MFLPWMVFFRVIIVHKKMLLLKQKMFFGVQSVVQEVLLEWVPDGLRKR